MALPISSCALNPTGAGFSCDLYESIPGNGTPSEINGFTTLPVGAVAGYVVLLEHGNPDVTGDQVQSNWSDVVVFSDANGGVTGTATRVQLLSDTCTCLPTPAQVLGNTHGFILEVQTGTGDDAVDFTTYLASPNTYHIFSGAPINEGENPVPEPASLTLLGTGLLAVARRKLKKT